MDLRERFSKLYFASTPLQRLWYLPPLGYKLQLPEILFVPLFFSALGNIRKFFHRSAWNVLDFFVLLWPVATLLPSLQSPLNFRNILDGAGAVYLVLLYFSVRLVLNEPARANFNGIVVLTSTLAALMGIFGWSLYTLLGSVTPLVIVRPYPYFGKMAQACAFTATPNMLASFLMMGIVFHLSNTLANREGPPRFWKTTFIILSLGFILTFSKTLFCLIPGVWIVLHLGSRNRDLGGQILKSRAVALTVIVASFFVYLLGTHFVITSTDPERVGALVKESYISDQPLYQLRIMQKQYGLYQTNYLHNKRSSILALKQSRGWGVGAGNYNAFIGGLQARKMHPKTFPQWDPHSTPFGALAELGVFGFLVVMALWLSSGILIYRNLRRKPTATVWSYALAGLFVAITMEAFVTDIMNFRHYWCLLAMARELSAKG